ncbi:hypothetical protein GUJ93_ZPchr0458g22395 [Zizania palustris]|uniref:Uncharacterized protein n=1 Tax=Zizania palustris TaxID=103762 RepID=A0A8J5R6R5_ZIZPA|nr:hypothetical protein GUJ93_ZPchr0458g22395 [Zizania palustris]
MTRHRVLGEVACFWLHRVFLSAPFPTGNRLRLRADDATIGRNSKQLAASALASSSSWTSDEAIELKEIILVILEFLWKVWFHEKHEGDACGLKKSLIHNYDDEEYIEKVKD